MREPRDEVAVVAGTSKGIGAEQKSRSAMTDDADSAGQFTFKPATAPIRHGGRRGQWRIPALIAALLVFVGGVWAVRQHQATPTPAMPAPLAQVTVSKPLVREVDTQLSFLGQFSAVDRVELRAQVGGTLKQIDFKDGQIVHQGDLLFVIDTRPFEIRLQQAKASLEAARARLALANIELWRAQQLKETTFGTAETVDQRLEEQRSDTAALASAVQAVKDARLDLDYCHVTAPFTGRIGTHLVSVGNLIAGSREATSPTTLLATIVSLDPIYLDFDMSEADFLTFSRYREQLKGPLAEQVEFALSDETQFARRGTLNFVDNVLDRSSGTIHARATVPNPDLFLTPGEFARLRLVVAPPAPILLVPDSAVLPDQSQHLVMTVSKDSTVVPKLVEIGELRGGLRVIRSGLNAGDRVIVDGLVYAAPGSRVATQDGAIRYATTGGQDGT